MLGVVESVASIGFVSILIAGGVLVMSGSVDGIRRHIQQNQICD